MKDSEAVHKSDEFTKANRKLQIIVCFEMVFTIVLSTLVYQTLIKTLWYQDYLELVMENWGKGPITELRIIPKDESCNADTMLEVMKTQLVADGHNGHDATNDD